MLSFCRDMDEEACPIADHVLAKLYSATENILTALVDAIEPDIKPALAFFCYRRAHLQAVGLAIAASCNESELVSFGGRAGAALFARAREERDVAQRSSGYAFRRKVTPPPGFVCRRPFDQETE
jgi:hypothetical protein